MRSNQLSFWYFLLLILMSSAGFTQSYHYSFEHYTTDNGLSHDNVLCILKDHKGFMWFGTYNGLNRFDGYHFKTFFHEQDVQNTLPSSSIVALTEDHFGKIWVATGGGMCRMDPATCTFEPIRLPALSSSETNKGSSNLAIDKAGAGWFLRGRYIYKIDLSTLKYTRYSIPVDARNVNQVFIDSKNRIWMVLQSGLYRFDDQTHVSNYLGGKSPGHDNEKVIFLSIYQLSDGKIWLQTWGNGLVYYDENSRQLVDYNDPPCAITALAEDYQNRKDRFLWAGGYRYGLMRYDFDTNRYSNFQNDVREPLSHNNALVRAIYVDSANEIVWFGSMAGIEKYDRKAIRFRRVLFPQDFTSSADQLVTAVVRDKTDATGHTYWVGIWAGGILKWNSKENTFIKPDILSGIKTLEVFDVIQDREGMIWIAEAKGLQVFDPRTHKFTRYYNNFLTKPFVNHKVLQLHEDRQGNIWIKTNYQGVFKWVRSTGRIQKIALPFENNQLKGEHPIWMDEDGHQNMWISSLSGIYKINILSNQLRFFDNSTRKHSKLPGDLYGGFCVAHDQTLWIGGEGYIAQLDSAGEVMRVYNSKTGLRADAMSRFAEDPAGNIWIGSFSYLHRLNPRTGQFSYFGKEDGLANNAQEDGFNMLEDGTLCIGFQRAFCMMNTLSIPFNTNKPNVQLTAVSIGSKEIRPKDETHIVIHPGESSLRLEFSSLNYTQSQKNLYAFKLDGYDKQWRIGTDRDYTVMNLPGGDHILHIKGMNNDGVWGDERSILFTVIPPFRETWLFKFIIVTIVIIGIYLLYWYRKQSRLKVDKMRNRIATDLHDDMGSTLSSIRILSEVASRDVEDHNPKAAMMLEKIKTDAAVLSENMQDIVWTIKTNNNSLGDVVTRMKEYGLKVLEAKNIEFHTHIAESFKASKLNLSQRRNLYLVFKEIINNAVKYASCSNVDLFITQQGRYLKMVLEDDGCGFDLQTVKKGNGLNNLRRRAAEINGKITIETAPGKGTRIDLLVRL